MIWLSLAGLVASRCWVCPQTDGLQLHLSDRKWSTCAHLISVTPPLMHSALSETVSCMFYTLQM